jgi:hypothetical protein
MKPINLRVRGETLELADALVAQRGLNRAALLREALEVGMLVIAASGPPAEYSAAASLSPQITKRHLCEPI